MAMDGGRWRQLATVAGVSFLANIGAAAAEQGSIQMDVEQMKQLFGGEPGWTAVGGAAGDVLRARIAESSLALGRITALQARRLLFYPTFQLYRAELATVPASQLHALVRGDEVFLLDGTAAPLQAVNRLEALRLDAATVIDYLAFFLDYAPGRGEAFRLVGTIDEVPFDGQATAEDRRKVAGLLQPLRVTGETAELFRLEGTVLFRQALFATSFVVRRDGAVNTMGEQLLLDDVPAEARPPVW